MRLSEFKREGVGSLTRFSSAFKDDKKNGYELLIVGSERQVESAFAESDIQVMIDPGMTRKKWEDSIEQTLRLKESVLPRDAFDDPSQHFKSSPTPPTSKNSIVCTLRRMQSGGTGFIVFAPGLKIPVNRSAFFVLPLSICCGGSVIPVAGDPDLFLRVNSLVGPTVAASRFGGLALDSVAFFPGFPFFPVFEVFGFRKSTTDFVASSFKLP